MYTRTRFSTVYLQSHIVRVHPLPRCRWQNGAPCSVGPLQKVLFLGVTRDPALYLDSAPAANGVAFGLCLLPGAGSERRQPLTAGAQSTARPETGQRQRRSCGERMGPPPALCASQEPSAQHGCAVRGKSPKPDAIARRISDHANRIPAMSSNQPRRDAPAALIGCLRTLWLASARPAHHKVPGQPPGRPCFLAIDPRPYRDPNGRLRSGPWRAGWRN